MMLKYNVRACSVLYNVLKANAVKGRVLIPSNICESVPATYMLLGIEPVFCDISAEDFQLDKEAAIKALDDSSITVLHYNHTYGFKSINDDLFLEKVKAKFPGVIIVDDRCLCFPELDYDNIVSDIVLFSTGSVKCVDLGWGGFGIIKDYLNYREYQLKYSKADLVEFDRHIKECHREDLPISEKVLSSDWLEILTEPQTNYFDLVKQRTIDAKAHKNRLNEIYSSIQGSLPLSYCTWRYQLLLENAKECIEALFDNGLFCSNHYKSLGNGYFNDVSTPNCNYLESHIVNLFNDFRFSYEQAIKTTDLLKKIAIPVER